MSIYTIGNANLSSANVREYLPNTIVSFQTAGFPVFNLFPFMVVFEEGTTDDLGLPRRPQTVQSTFANGNTSALPVFAALDSIRALVSICGSSFVHNETPSTFTIVDIDPHRNHAALNPAAEWTVRNEMDYEVMMSHGGFLGIDHGQKLELYLRRASGRLLCARKKATMIEDRIQYLIEQTIGSGESFGPGESFEETIGRLQTDLTKFLGLMRGWDTLPQQPMVLLFCLIQSLNVTPPGPTTREIYALRESLRAIAQFCSVEFAAEPDQSEAMSIAALIWSTATASLEQMISSKEVQIASMNFPDTL